MVWQHLHFDECEAASKELAEKLLRSGDVHFIARDLGFGDHTGIGEAVRPVIAKWVARTMVRWRDETERCAHRLIEARTALTRSNKDDRHESL